MSNKIKTMKTINFSETFSSAFSVGLSFGKKIIFFALILGLFVFSASSVFSQTEETLPPCGEESCGGQPPASEPIADEAVIFTGDAQSDVTVENTANTSEMSVGDLEAPAPTLSSSIFS